MTRALRAATLLLAACFLAGAASAITANNAPCTLANAIRSANTDTSIGGCAAGSGGDLIELEYDVTLAAEDPGSSLLAGARAGLPDVVANLVIDGNGHFVRREPTLGCRATSEGSDFRLFQVTGGFLSLIDIKLSNGCVLDATEARGGAVLASGGAALFIKSCTISNSMARGADGSAIQTAGNAYGGAIEASGPLEVVPEFFTASTFSGNVARGGDDSTGNHPGGLAAGGAIHGSDITINTVSFLGNSALGGSATASHGGGLAAGGAVNGALTFMTHATFSGNTAMGGNAASGEAGSAYGGGFDSSITASVDSLLVRDNVARGGTSGSGRGGAAVGGGALISPGGGVDREVRDCWFEGNRAFGGSSTSAAGGNGEGGGAGLHGTDGALVISHCTFSDNQTLGGSGPGLVVDDYAGSGLGGGLRIGRPTPSTVATLANVTLYGNVANGGAALANGGIAGGGLGGGIYSPGNTLTIASSTIAANQANAGSGDVNGDSVGGGIDAAGSLTLGNSILADNTNAGGGADCFWGGGAFTSAGYNWVESPSGSDCTGGPGSHQGADPGLGAFGDHNCVSQVPSDDCPPTVALPGNSPAIDQGNAAAAFTVSDDGRGYVRPQDLASANAADGSDIGAYELPADQLEIAVTESVDPVVIVSPSSSFTHTVTVTNTGVNLSQSIDVLVDCTALPSGVSFSNASNSGGNAPSCPVAGWCTWSIDALSVGSLATLTLTFTVSPAAVPGSRVTCSGKVTGATPAGILPAAFETTLLIGPLLFSDGFETSLGVWSDRTP